MPARSRRRPCLAIAAETKADVAMILRAADLNAIDCREQPQLVAKGPQILERRGQPPQSTLSCPAAGARSTGSRYRARTGCSESGGTGRHTVPAACIRAGARRYLCKQNLPVNQPLEIGIAELGHGMRIDGSERMRAPVMRTTNSAEAHCAASSSCGARSMLEVEQHDQMQIASVAPARSPSDT